jgi:hypothetical protein
MADPLDSENADYIPADRKVIGTEIEGLRSGRLGCALVGKRTRLTCFEILSVIIFARFAVLASIDRTRIAT